MSPHNICFHGEIRKISAFFQTKKTPYLLLCEMSNPICMDNKKQYRQLLCFAQRVLKTSNSVFRENGGVNSQQELSIFLLL